MQKTSKLRTMKVAVVYNRSRSNVINELGVPNREPFSAEDLERIVGALAEGDHQVTTFEGDMDLVDNIGSFMPRVLKEERPGIVFNVSYGIQGQARYTHVPSVLEMIGVPYVGSGPLAHSIALDKIVTKMILAEHGLPTPEYAVVEDPDGEMPDLGFPAIVKPKNEAMSLGIRIVEDEDALRDAVRNIVERFEQEALVERFVEGREIYIGLLGNDVPTAFSPCELVFASGGPTALLYDDKTKRSGRKVHLAIPDDLDPATVASAKDLARRAFKAIGARDFARIDMRLDTDGEWHILEINTLPGLSQDSPYPVAAEADGLDFVSLVNELVDVASERYFGSRERRPAERSGEPLDKRLFRGRTRRRDAIEEELGDWTRVSSRTGDLFGVREAMRMLDGRLVETGLHRVSDLTDDHYGWTWESPAGLNGGTLLLVALDVPLDASTPPQRFEVGPQWLHGEGIASSRAAVVMATEALRALSEEGLLERTPVGILAYGDAGADGQFSADLIRRAAGRAKEVLALDPVREGEGIVHDAPGLATLHTVFEVEPRRVGRARLVPAALRRLIELEGLTAPGDGVDVAVGSVSTETLTRRPPHRLEADLMVRYRDDAARRAWISTAEDLLSEVDVVAHIGERGHYPPVRDGEPTRHLVAELRALAEEWDVPLASESADSPTLAGLAPEGTAAVGGLGPVARGVHRPDEAIDRTAFMQRLILITQHLAKRTRPSTTEGRLSDVVKVR
ncbi:MAG: ATP-grasp domain-containing protein [Euryarchaeota archaeon]|nr:ATP-grasp domain-containing protein [Euryarchaeota archaeon]